jgi:hypothetical protein
MKSKFLNVLLFSLVFVGCSTAFKQTALEDSAHFTKTSGSQFATKNDDCSFDIITTTPQKPYDEIGVIEFLPLYIKDIATFKSATQKIICKSGGDGVIPVINSHGYYIKATVIKYKN